MHKLINALQHYFVVMHGSLTSMGLSSYLPVFFLVAKMMFVLISRNKVMALGKVRVKVLNGRNLQNKETLSTSDPYCMVELRDQVMKTKHKSSDLNPDWGEEFAFSVNPGDEVLCLSIWDKNTVKKDAFMGYTFVSFDDCVKDQPTAKVR